MTLIIRNPPPPDAMVDGLNATFGRHDRARASHAKGVSADGYFKPEAGAQLTFLTPLFTPGRYPARMRFSIAGGNPNISDKAPAARGLGLRIDLPDDQHLTVAAISTPTFFAASPDSFLAFLEARRPDPATGKPDPARVAASNRIHMDSEAQRRWLAAVPPSASYATAPYFPTHTYYFRTPEGSQPARWLFEPEAGRIGLTAEQLASLPDHYLADELATRLALGEASWTVDLVLPEPIDPLLNPTAAWPEDRRRIRVGRLVVRTVDQLVLSDGVDTHVFDPTHLPDGIEPPQDPIFAVRSEAYAVSAQRRGL